MAQTQWVPVGEDGDRWEIPEQDTDRRCRLVREGDAYVELSGTTVLRYDVTADDPAADVRWGTCTHVKGGRTELNDVSNGDVWGFLRSVAGVDAEFWQEGR